MAKQGWHVLDRLAVPVGLFELVTHRRHGATWIGVRGEDGKVIASFAPGAGSVEKQVTCTAIIADTWAVSFGAVAHGIVRAEILNDAGEAFPARILALPEGLNPDDRYRAVWGIGERCQERCEVVGYDKNGDLFDQTDPEVVGPPPSEHERFVAMRERADSSMRFYATAHLRQSESNRQFIDAAMSTVANFLALMEGPALDDRSMLSRRRRIIRRYLEQAETDPWEPGVCSFCGNRPVVAWFEGPAFTNAVRSSAEVRSGEAWLVCATCFELVDADDRDEAGETKRDPGRASRSPSSRYGA
jgi:hypothetical protein